MVAADPRIVQLATEVLELWGADPTIEDIDGDGRVLAFPADLEPPALPVLVGVPVVRDSLGAMRLAPSAREGVLVGGCREWFLPLSFDDVLAAPQRLAADERGRWPAGADPASVCQGGRSYVVTLRPLLPGEQP